MTRGTHATRAALASVAVAMLLVGLKSFAAIRTDSVAMLGSLADSGLDLVASLVTLWGIRVAATPADWDHRFGHGKAEALAALFQVALISASAIGIVLEASALLSAGRQSTDAALGIGVSVIAAVATSALLAYQRRVLRRVSSVAIRADHLHYQSDLLLNGAVIVALALEQIAHVRGADPVFGIVIALWLLFGAWRAALDAVGQLMDKEWPEARRGALLEVIGRHPRLQGVHDLRTRTSGTYDFVQFHIELDPTMSVHAAHDVMEEIELDVEAAFPGVEVLIHPDPVGHVDRHGKLSRDISERPLL